LSKIGGRPPTRPAARRRVVGRALRPRGGDPLRTAGRPTDRPGGRVHQSHLHRDVDAFTGLTPTAVAAAPWLVIDDVAWPASSRSA